MAHVGRYTVDGTGDEDGRMGEAEGCWLVTCEPVRCSGEGEEGSRGGAWHPPGRSSLCSSLNKDVRNSR